jgi:DNA-binding IclR family transcriptional regulator
MAGSQSIEQLSAVLELFGEERGLVSVDEIIDALDLTRSTGYRTVRALVETGLLDRISDDGYVLGPRILELYRQLQTGNPLLAVARPLMMALAAESANGTAVLLCRSYRDQVMCLHQEMTYGPQEPVSYQVGKPMPLYAGSSSLVVLAAMPRARLQRLYERDKGLIAKTGLAKSEDEFFQVLKQIRKEGSRVSYGEVDRGRIGVSAPFVQSDLGIIGCLSVVLSQAHASDMDISRARLQVVAAAQEVSRKLANVVEGKTARASARRKATGRNG